MGKIVLDTNCLIQVLPRQSRYHDVWLSFLDGRNILCVSNEILDEYVEILQRLISVEVAEYVVKTILNSAFVRFVTPYYKYGLIQLDPDDNKFVDCALAVSARCIVTNDHHYDVLQTTSFPHVDVVSLVDFHKELQRRKSCKHS